MVQTDGIYIVIPAYNAAPHLKSVLPQLRQFVPTHQIIMVNDGSTDQTADLILGHTNILYHEHSKNQGKGQALQSGFQLALDQPDLRAVITLDADGQHEPHFIPAFIKLYNQRNFDLIIGARSRNLSAMPVHRIMSNSITSLMLSLRSGVSIRDSQSGFRLIDKQILASVKTKFSGYQAETELVLHSALRGSRIGFVPVSTVYGEEASYIRPIHDIIDFVRIYGRSFFWNI